MAHVQGVPSARRPGLVDFDLGVPSSFLNFGHVGLDGPGVASCGFCGASKYLVRFDESPANVAITSVLARRDDVASSM